MDFDTIIDIFVSQMHQENLTLSDMRSRLSQVYDDATLDRVVQAISFRLEAFQIQGSVLFN